MSIRVCFISRPRQSCVSISNKTSLLDWERREASAAIKDTFGRLRKAEVFWPGLKWTSRLTAEDLRSDSTSPLAKYTPSQAATVLLFKSRHVCIGMLNRHFGKSGTFPILLAGEPLTSIPVCQLPLEDL
jgi:hypothetical protein